MQCKYNSFTKKPDSKTAFNLKSGEAIFSQTVYILQPIYIHKRSPAFTLVSKSKHVSGLFPVAESWYIGDFNKQTILLFLKEDRADLFLIDGSPMVVKNNFLSGQLNEALFEARQEAAKV